MSVSCDSCGQECQAACGSRHFRACCFNYLRKRSPIPAMVNHPIIKIPEQYDADPYFYPKFQYEYLLAKTKGSPLEKTKSQLEPYQPYHNFQPAKVDFYMDEGDEIVPVEVRAKKRSNNTYVEN